MDIIKPLQNTVFKCCVMFLGGFLFDKKVLVEVCLVFYVSDIY